MAEFRTEPLVVTSVSGLLPPDERDRRVALSSFAPSAERPAVPMREVRCYECGKRTSVPAAALSAACTHCHTHLNMTDVELKPTSRRLTIRTVGKVHVQPDTVLSHLSVVCSDMKILGQVSGAFRCSGTLTFANSMRVEGKVAAKHLIIEKGAEVVFTEEAEVDTAVIEGRLAGVLRARTLVTVPRGGEMLGTCICPKIDVEPGGHYRGGEAV